jgi:hypothetical protein
MRVNNYIVHIKTDCRKGQVDESGMLSQYRPQGGDETVPFGLRVIARIQWTNEDEINECKIDEMIRALMPSKLAWVRAEGYSDPDCERVIDMSCRRQIDSLYDLSSGQYKVV